MKNERQPNPIAVEFGEKLFAVASTRGFHTQQFAQLLGVHSSYLYKIRDGIRVPSSEIIERYKEVVAPNADEEETLMSFYNQLRQEGYGAKRGEPRTRRINRDANKTQVDPEERRRKNRRAQMDRQRRIHGVSLDIDLQPDRLQII